MIAKLFAWYEASRWKIVSDRVDRGTDLWQLQRSTPMDPSQNGAWFYDLIAKSKSCQKPYPIVTPQALNAFYSLFPAVPITYQTNPPLVPNTDDPEVLCAAGGHAWRAAAYHVFGKLLPAIPVGQGTVPGLIELRELGISPTIWLAWFIKDETKCVKRTNKWLSRTVIRAAYKQFLIKADHCCNCVVMLPEHRVAQDIRGTAEYTLYEEGADYADDVSILLKGYVKPYSAALRKLNAAVKKYRKDEAKKLRRHLWIWNRTP